MRNVERSGSRRVLAAQTAEAQQLTAEEEALIERFPATIRREVRRLARSSRRLAEAAVVFPGVLFALASRRGPSSQRLEALALIEIGAPLKNVARTLALPLWLKKLPPEAFAGPLETLPTTETFARRIAARLPLNPEESAFWLASIAFGARAANEDFAVWLAEQPLFDETDVPERLFGILAAYAWYSTALGTRAHQLIVVPWRPEIALDTAVCAAKSWFNRMRLVMQLGQGVLSDTWLEGGTVNGYTIHPLIEQSELLAEAHQMQNCADQYSERLSRERCRLFSIRRGGTRVATMEIGPHPRETGVLAIVQLKARHNMPAPTEVWQAAYGWLAAQARLKRLAPVISPDRPFAAQIWTELLQPYREAVGGANWLPATPLQSAIAALDHDLGELARRGCVNSWLFT